MNDDVQTNTSIQTKYDFDVANRPQSHHQIVPNLDTWGAINVRLNFATKKQTTLVDLCHVSTTTAVQSQTTENYYAE